MSGRTEKQERPEKQPETNAAGGPVHDWRKLRLWQIQPIRDVLVLVGIVGLIYIGYLCSIVTVPILLALALAYLFEPLVAWSTRRFRWLSRQGAAVGIIVLVAGLVIVPITIGVGFAIVQGATLVGTVADNAKYVVASVQAETPAERTAAREALPKSLQDVGQWLGELRSEVQQYRSIREHDKPDGAGEGAPPPLPPPTSESDSDAPPPQPEVVVGGVEIPLWKVQLYEGLEIAIRWVQNNADAVAKNIGQQALGTGVVAFGALVAGAQKVGYIIFTGFLTAFFFFFFCTGYGQVLEFWEDLIPERKKHRVIDLVRQMDRVVAGFVRGRITICFILAIYMTVAYWLIGVPSPLLLGPVVGALFIVPYVNIIGVPVAIILMAIDPSGAAWPHWWWIVFAPIGVYMGAQLLDDWVLSPTIQGKSTGMDTPTILFASFAGGAIGGIYGLLLAIPVAACIRILLKDLFWPRFRAWGKGKERDFLPIARE